MTGAPAALASLLAAHPALRLLAIGVPPPAHAGEVEAVPQATAAALAALHPARRRVFDLVVLAEPTDLAPLLPCITRRTVFACLGNTAPPGEILRLPGLTLARAVREGPWLGMAQPPPNPAGTDAATPWLAGLGEDRPVPLDPDDDSPCPALVERVELAPARSWVRREPRLLLDLSRPDRPRRLRFAEGPRLSARKLLDRFAGVELGWSDCLIAGNRFMPHYIPKAAYYASVLTGRDADSVAGRASGLVLVDGRPAIGERTLADAEHVSEPVLCATAEEPHHWGLFLLSSLPVLVREHGRPTMAWLHHRNHRQVLELAGVDPAAIRRHDVMRRYRFDDVTMIRRGGYSLHVAPWERRIFEAIVARAGQAATPRRVYISRRARNAELPGYRELLNEAALIDALAPLGFVPVAPETLDAAAQVRLFAGAEAIVGAGGGGLFNAVFCRPGTRLISIESTQTYLETHADLFASLDLDHGFIIGAQDPADHRPVNRNWTIDIPQAVAAIAASLG